MGRAIWFDYGQLTIKPSNVKVLKVVPLSHVDETQRRRLLNEASVLKAVTHRNVVKLHKHWIEKVSRLPVTIYLGFVQKTEHCVDRVP